MQGQNPYAPPQVAAQGAWHVPGATFNAWIEGKELAVQKSASLPDVCLKCGAPESSLRRPQQFVFTPQWVIFIVIFSPLIGAIVAFVVQKKGRLELPLCGRCFAASKRAHRLLLASLLWLIFGLIAGIVAFVNELPEAGVPLVISSFSFLLVVAVMNRKSFVRAKKVDEQSIWLCEIHPRATEAILAAAHGQPHA